MNRNFQINYIYGIIYYSICHVCGNLTQFKIANKLNKKAIKIKFQHYLSPRWNPIIMMIITLIGAYIKSIEILVFSKIDPLSWFNKSIHEKTNCNVWYWRINWIPKKINVFAYIHNDICKTAHVTISACNFTSDLHYFLFFYRFRPLY